MPSSASRTEPDTKHWQRDRLDCYVREIFFGNRDFNTLESSKVLKIAAFADVSKKLNVMRAKAGVFSKLLNLRFMGDSS
jgi:hypothetical protein